MNQKSMKMGELVSAACQCNARGLAKLAAIMVNRGKLDGKQLISEQTYDEFMSEPKFELNCGMGQPTSFTKGGVNLFRHVEKNKP